MSVYFKIQMQYKRTHDGNIIETTGCNVARPFLVRCLAIKKGPAPSRVLTDRSFTFTSTEFPVDQNCCIRLCEAASRKSVFVRGILMVTHGESVHLRAFHTMLAVKAHSRTRISDLSRRFHDIIKLEGSHEANLSDRISLLESLGSERTRYRRLCKELSSLKAGVPGLPVISVKTCAVPSSLDDAEAQAKTALVAIDEDEYFAMILLSSKHATVEPRKQLSFRCVPTDRIIKLFENGLLSRHPKEDFWEERGSLLFRKTLRYFLEREIPIQFCLPAFPCKSTNPRKTSSPSPDGAEYEAFCNLHQFCIDVRDIYPPGADFIVVSDGHVFSDCIGTDDSEVYKYTTAVKELSEKIRSSHSLTSSESPITFVNLHDVFHGPKMLLRNGLEIDWTEKDIFRPIRTKIDPKDEECRKMMLHSCGFDAGMLEKATKDDQNHSLTKVYRGFSRFMKDVSSLHTP